jgi:hypothetical protein
LVQFSDGKNSLKIRETLKTGERGKSRLGTNKSKSLFNLVLLLFLLADPASGASHRVHTSALFDRDQPGITAADFLKIGIGAKARGMGGAFVGLADDPSAVYWNPAGLSQLDRSQAMFMHDRWAQDIRYEYLGCAFPIDHRNAVAIGVVLLHMGEILGYDENDKPTSFFSAYDAAMLLGYSRRISSRLSLGWTAKGILEKLEDEKAHAAAFDMGFFYDSSILSFGMSLRNLGTRLKFLEKKHPLPTCLRVGIAFKALNNHLLLSTDADLLTDSAPVSRHGIEYNFRNVLFARGGVKYNTQDQSSPGSTTPTAGGGIKVSKLQLDYSYCSANFMGNLHNFSLTYRFASE